MGRDLLSKLQAQISFQTDGKAALSFGSGPPGVLALITPLGRKEITFSSNYLKGVRDAL
jgi:hypothetical protein